MKFANESHSLIKIGTITKHNNEYLKTSLEIIEIS